MADEQATEVQVATPPETPPEAPKAETPKAEPEPDYKALVAEREGERDAALAKLAKQENDLRSLRGSRARDTDERDKYATLIGEVKFLGENVDFLTQNLLGEEHAKTLAQLKEKRQLERTTEQLNAWVQQRYSQLNKANLDEAGNAVLDLAEAPELADVRNRWNAGAQKGDKDAIHDALLDAVTIINKVKREKDKAAAQVASKVPPAKSKVPPPEEEADMDTGPGAGGGGQVSDSEIDAAWVKYDREHPGKENPFDAQYRKVLGGR